MHIQCPECFMTYELDELLRGKTARCKQCGAAIVLDEASWHVKIPPKSKPNVEPSKNTERSPQFIPARASEAESTFVPTEHRERRSPARSDVNAARIGKWLAIVYSLVAGPGTTLVTWWLVQSILSEREMLRILLPAYVISYLIGWPMWKDWHCGALVWHVARLPILALTFFVLVFDARRAPPGYFLWVLGLLGFNWFGCMMLPSKELNRSGLFLAIFLVAAGDLGLWLLLWFGKGWHVSAWV